jgi:hypothetical protein
LQLAALHQRIRYTAQATLTVPSSVISDPGKNAAVRWLRRIAQRNAQVACCKARCARRSTYRPKRRESRKWIVQSSSRPRRPFHLWGNHGLPRSALGVCVASGEPKAVVRGVGTACGQPRQCRRESSWSQGVPRDVSRGVTEASLNISKDTSKTSGTACFEPTA